MCEVKTQTQISRVICVNERVSRKKKIKTFFSEFFLVKSNPHTKKKKPKKKGNFSKQNLALKVTFAHHDCWSFVCDEPTPSGLFALFTK